MFNKNVFTQTDAVADLIKGINEADYKAKMEALKGDQHKIDKNKNNKIDAHDFKLLRGEKKPMKEDKVEEDSNVKIPTSTGTRVLGHRYGNAAKTYRDSLADPFAVVRGPGKKDIEDLEKKKTKKEEVEQADEATALQQFRNNPRAGQNQPANKDGSAFNPMKHITDPKKKKELAPYAKLVDRGSYGQRAALNKAGGVKDDRGPRGVTQEEAELDEANSESEKDFLARQERLAAAAAQTAKDPARLKRMMSIPGYSAAMGLANKTTTKEEVEELDELSKTTLGSYAKKASRDAAITRKIGADFDAAGKRATSPRMKAAHDELSQKYKEKSWKRRDGVEKAVDRLTKEEAEQLDELSPKTLKSYAKKSEPQAISSLAAAHDKVQNYIEKTGKAPSSEKHVMKIAGKEIMHAAKRTKGLERVQNRLAKEEVEELDERELSKGETAEKERIVKGMKKSLAGFKARYGDKAKSVMYATATARAKKD